MPARYRFDTTWRARAEPAIVWDVLYDVPSYPEWWPEVKRVVERRAHEAYELSVRSILPYRLTFTLHQRDADRDGGLLDAELRGELAGFSRWTIRPAPAGSILRYEQEVVTTPPLFNVLAPLARPAFVANHAWMMRSGERGLQTFLAGHRFGREGPRGRHQEAARRRGQAAER